VIITKRVVNPEVVTPARVEVTGEVRLEDGRKLELRDTGARMTSLVLSSEGGPSQIGTVNEAGIGLLRPDLAKYVAQFRAHTEEEKAA
jgi:hypothetical protein